MSTTYRIEIYDESTQRWTADGIGESRNWPTRRLATRAARDLARTLAHDFPESPQTRTRVVVEESHTAA